ncbi:GNAT family N-acetyltransferase [Deinococcus indicus]|uniref:GNAT family N-acetyltransferase n=1 Tax=Deinococcus indicus TaxID=223556 RepID=A0A246BH58_9DEIO|nr:GNAT family N-acetyltransferase [Deinococcus indicus]OWL94514.1 GNAT family N-acetyltransferase [Deinococcus indicus]GHG22791.1 phosphinothricin acetyltransferase [Deinococcus indicus]
MITVTPIAEHEWDAAAAILTGANPHEPLTGEEYRHQMREQQDWGYGWAVFVAHAGGEVAGVAGYHQNPGAFHPHRYDLDLAVAPHAQRRGIGAALWNTLAADLRARNAESARILAREDHPVAPGFLTRRGFTGGKRYFMSTLHVPDFDPTPYAVLEERVQARGVRLRSLTDLRAADTPDLVGRLHALMSDVRQDVPRAEPATPLTRQVFEDAILGDPGLLPDAYLIAEVGGDWVGQTTLFRSDASPDLLTGLTGVTRSWRGQGVATALKLAAIRAARTLNATTIRTDNASDNAPMLAINDRLGFVRDPASVSYVTRFG